MTQSRSATPPNAYRTRAGSVYNRSHPGGQKNAALEIQRRDKNEKITDRVGTRGFDHRRGFSGRCAGSERQEVIYVSSGKATYKASPMGGVSQQVLVGDPDKGPHATFSKFDPGYDAGMHTHTNDVSLVVIKGAYLYKDEAGEKRVGPGEFLFVPGGHKHWSGETRLKARFFMKKVPESSTLYREVAKVQDHRNIAYGDLYAQRVAGVAPGRYSCCQLRRPCATSLAKTARTRFHGVNNPVLPRVIFFLSLFSPI